MRCSSPRVPVVLLFGLGLVGGAAACGSPAHVTDGPVSVAGPEPRNEPVPSAALPDAPEAAPREVAPLRSLQTARLGGDGRVFPSDLEWVGDAYAVVYSDTPVGGRGRMHFMRVSADGEVLVDRDLGYGNRPELAFTGTELGMSYSDQRPGWGVRFMRLSPDGQPIADSDVGLSDGEADHAHIAYSPRDREWVVMWGQFRAPHWQVVAVFVGEDGGAPRTVMLAQGTGGFRFVGNVVWAGGGYAATFTPDAELVELTNAGITRRTPVPYGWPGGSAHVARDGEKLVVAHSLRPNLVALSRFSAGQLARLAVIEEADNRFVNGATVTPSAGGYLLLWEAHTSAVPDSRLYFAWLDRDGIPGSSGRLVAAEDYQGFHRVDAGGPQPAVLHTIGQYTGQPRAYLTRVPPGAEPAVDGPAPLRTGP